MLAKPVTVGRQRQLIEALTEVAADPRGQIGYASAASFILMIILMAVALIQLAVNRKAGPR